ncbi:ribosome silencing factor [Synechococcus sp. CS-602]|nr:ribosome silencing factor [Synechococcus sp. CS-603]MCT0203636.1 ribosome silencing factor [Synechococcus sp. CS-602]MCT0246076.1 ribosome silencing factor [Synechococcus sp. CS-601]TWB96662.1 ribosome-associated protein [Synechococcus sp. Ace-Pa]
MDSDQLARLAAEACDDRKAVDICLIRVDEVSSLADWFVICSGLSDVQVRAIARSVEDRLELEATRLPRGKEGQREGHWVLLDYGELIVHVLSARDREYYDLEAFWGHGEQVPFLSSSSFPPDEIPPLRPHGSGLPVPTLSGADEPAAP